MLYFAIVLSTNQLPGNRFVNAAVAVCIDLVSNAMCWLVIEYVDRRKTFMLFSAITSVGLAGIPFLTEGIWTDERLTLPLALHLKKRFVFLRCNSL